MVIGRIRKSVIAGTWYPGNREALHSAVNGFFQNVPPPAVQGEIVSIVSPHAGYIYSGQVAAFAYRTVLNQAYDSVIVIGPSHRVAFHGASVYDEGGFETPLGIVAIDERLAKDILSSEGNAVFSGAAEHAQEHSIEIQLPFLQTALKEIRFVPVLMGDQDRSTCNKLAQAIASASKGKRVLIVGSSDLSHYHSYDQAVKMDRIVLKRMEKFDPEGLLEDLQEQAAEACGGGPVAVAMMAARQLGADSSSVLKYANSGDVTGDKSGVVGYAAAVFYKKVH